jgi:DNA-binding transcriptional ArsR family regulator
LDVNPEDKPAQSLTTADLLHIASHPTRLDILRQIQKGKSYASKLQEYMNIDRKIISFHLSVLERSGLVDSEFGLKNKPESKPVAVRYYALNLKGEEILNRINTALE